MFHSTLRGRRQITTTHIFTQALDYKTSKGLVARLHMIRSKRKGVYATLSGIPAYLLNGLIAKESVSLPSRPCTVGPPFVVAHAIPPRLPSRSIVRMMDQRFVLGRQSCLSSGA